MDQLPYYGEDARYEKDKEIKEILDASYKRAYDLILKNKYLLLKLADVGSLDMNDDDCDDLGCYF